MRPQLAHLIEALKAAIQDQARVSVADIEGIMAEVMALFDPDCIGPLALMLDDDAEFHEWNWSIIHSIEAVGLSTYIERLFTVLPALVQQSPYYATVLHFRILNSDSARAVYAARLQRSNPEERAAAETVLLGVCQQAPQFADRVDAIVSV